MKFSEYYKNILEDLHNKSEKEVLKEVYNIRKGMIFDMDDSAIKMVTMAEIGNTPAQVFYVLNSKLNYNDPYVSGYIKSCPDHKRLGQVVASASNLNRARNIRDKKDSEYGGATHFIIGQYGDNGPYVRF